MPDYDPEIEAFIGMNAISLRNVANGSETDNEHMRNNDWRRLIKRPGQPPQRRPQYQQPPPSYDYPPANYPPNYNEPPPNYGMGDVPLPENLAQAPSLLRVPTLKDPNGRPLIPPSVSPNGQPMSVDFLHGPGLKTDGFQMPNYGQPAETFIDPDVDNKFEKIIKEIRLLKKEVKKLTTFLENQGKQPAAPISASASSKEVEKNEEETLPQSLDEITFNP